MKNKKINQASAERKMKKTFGDEEPKMNEIPNTIEYYF
jgi:hypothetical protein